MCCCKCIAIKLTFKYYIVVKSTKACVVVLLLHFVFVLFLNSANLSFYSGSDEAALPRHFSATVTEGEPFRRVSKRLTHFVVLQE